MKKIIIIMVVLFVAFATYAVLENSQTQEKFATLVEVCRGKPVSEARAYENKPGLHPAMSVMKSEAGSFRIYPYATPDEILAKSIAETELVLCLTEPKKVLVDSCPYTTETDGKKATNVVERYRFEQQVSLLEAKTAKVLAGETLKGEEPRKCLKQEVFLKGVDKNEVIGKDISDATLGEWLRPHAIM